MGHVTSSEGCSSSTGGSLGCVHSTKTRCVNSLRYETMRYSLGLLTFRCLCCHLVVDSNNKEAGSVTASHVYQRKLVSYRQRDKFHMHTSVQHIHTSHLYILSPTGIAMITSASFLLHETRYMFAQYAGIA